MQPTSLAHRVFTPATPTRSASAPEPEPTENIVRGPEDVIEPSVGQRAIGVAAGTATILGGIVLAKLLGDVSPALAAISMVGGMAGGVAVGVSLPYYLAGNRYE